ncbi:MAG: hypothetical protein AAF805_10350 [Planctomycetota bacterium]
MLLKSVNRPFVGALLVGVGAGATWARLAIEHASPRTLDTAQALAMIVGLVLVHGLTKTPEATSPS